MKKTVLCLVSAIFGGAASALAIPTTLGIDFRSAIWNPAPNAQQESVGSVTATAAFPPGSTLGWSSTAGLGVNSPWLFGLGSIDILNVSFSAGAGNGLTGAWVTNLFAGLDGKGLLVLNTSQGTDYLGFSGWQTSSQNPLGDLYVNFGGAQNVTSAQFFDVNALGGLLGGKDYSVAGFTRAVPDGGTTLTLLGISLIGLAALRRWQFPASKKLVKII